MNNKSEKITGRLQLFAGEWKVASGYGTFPLAPALQATPDTATANGAWVTATVRHGLVIGYGFESTPIG